MSSSDTITICDSIENILREKLFHPRVKGQALDDLITNVIADCRKASSNDIATHVNESLKALDVSNTAFWSTPGRAISSQWAINATLQMFLEGTQEVWIFKDVLSGGTADRAGVKPGDELTAIDGLIVTNEPRFQLGRTYTLSLRNASGARRDVSVQLPAVGPKNRPPMSEPKALSSSIIQPGLGLLRVGAFPSIIGFDFARELNALIQDFKRQNCSRLIVDLRGNCGGGLGSLRLMSFLTPGRLDAGYSLSKNELTQNPATLPIINRIPNTKLGLALMALRFKVFHRGRSLKLVTEGLGHQPFHGKIAVLVNESSRSGAEMVAAFAQRHGLAKIVGTNTPGETLGAANFIVQEEYRLRIPLVGWFLPDGQMLEGRGVAPDRTAAPTLSGLRSGRDEVLDVAVAALA